MGSPRAHMAPGGQARALVSSAALQESILTLVSQVMGDASFLQGTSKVAVYAELISGSVLLWSIAYSYAQCRGQCPL